MEFKNLKKKIRESRIFIPCDFHLRSSTNLSQQSPLSGISRLQSSYRPARLLTPLCRLSWLKGSYKTPTSSALYEVNTEGEIRVDVVIKLFT